MSDPKAEQAQKDQAVREEIEALLEGGLETRWAERGDTHEKIQEILGRLKAGDGSLRSRLVESGWTLHPVEHGEIEQACETC
ncbi:MAG: hypothetical protein KDD47_14100, partial [Acidobacteria bacterium]|nr:hypothetical protein [Acidobacteriota bacterium]